MSYTINSTPRKDGFRMPGEFEKHDGCWMIWPERSDNWRYGAKPAQYAFTQVATAISQFEPVVMCVSPQQWLHARMALPQSVKIVEMTSNDSWMRDVGPTFVVNEEGEVRGVDWDFNAWGGLEGGLYFPWDQDQMIAEKVLEVTNVPRYKAPLVMEGGSIHVDGQGTLIVTEECLLNPNRNPDLTKAEIEGYLREYLNVDKIIWIPRGVYNDETNGHVDNLLCFARPGEVILTWTDDVNDPQYEISKEAYEILTNSVDAQGRKLKVHKIHQPGPILITEEESKGVDAIEGTQPRNPGDRLAGSYINHYIANGGVVVPVFNDPYDSAALVKLQEIYYDKTVVGVPAREILLGGGNIHCITQQQSSGVRIVQHV